ncbi:MAG: NACHT domain-containing protein [Streptomyces sp.]|nr:NACHT domain-containing protein [Streptomyces sp.]
MGKGIVGRVLARLALGLVALVPAWWAVTRWWRGEAVRHPVLAGLAAFGYLVVTVAAGFVLKVVGDVQGRLVTRAADRMEPLVLSGVSGFSRRYRRHLRVRHGASDLKGITILGVRPPRLDDVFVDVSLTPRPLHELGQEPLVGMGPTAPSQERRSLPQLLDGPEPVVLAVIGAPGSGKTTLLAHTALALTAMGPFRRRRRRLPVLVFLRDHAERIVQADGPADSSGGEPVGVADLVRASLARFSLAAPAGWFERRLKAGRCVVMIDGLDEVGRTVDRRRVANWVDRQIVRYPGNHWVLTSRPHGYWSATLREATTLEVRRFTPDQVRRFVHGWYRAVERTDNGSRPAPGGDPGSRADDLLRRLQSVPMLYDLAANPLLLTMIANVHRFRGALPGTRSALYAEICEVLLWQRHEAKELPSEDVSGEDKQAVLAGLAYRMMTERVREVAEDSAEEWLRPVLDGVGFTGPARRFLAEVATCGLLVERETGVYSFAHQTFQEYLAAAHILDSGRREVLVDAVEDPWWRETTLLWAARTDPTAVVRACLGRPSAATVALAFDCVEEAGRPPREAEAGLDDLRRQALSSPPGSELHRLMTAVTVRRQLRGVVWLGDSTLVCARPVTYTLFRLFRAEHPAARAAFEVDGGADEPVLTVGARDAEELVHWVNAGLAGSSAYRLPTPEEAADPAILPLLGPGRGMWTADGPGGGASLWLPADVPDPWTVSGARIHERRRADQDAARARPAPAAGTAAMLDAENPPSLRLSAAPDDAPLRHAVHDGPALEQAQSLVNAVHEALRDDLAGLRRRLESRTSGASSPTSGRIFDTTPETVRDALSLVHRELDHAGPQHSVTDPVGAVLCLGRGLARVADLLMARARADAALDGERPRRHDQVRQAVASYLQGPAERDEAARRVLEIVESAPPADVDPLDLLLQLSAVLHRAGATGAVRRSTAERPGTVGADTGVLLRAARLCGLADLLTEHVAPFERGIPDTASDARTVSPEMFLGALERVPALAATRLAHLTRTERVIWGVPPMTGAGGESSRTVDVPWAARCAHAVAEELRDVGREPAGGAIHAPVPAAALRRGALALAASADQTEAGSEVAEQCRTVAAGITVLQDRAEGVSPPREAVLLVRV